MAAQGLMALEIEGVDPASVRYVLHAPGSLVLDRKAKSFCVDKVTTAPPLSDIFTCTICLRVSNVTYFGAPVTRLSCHYGSAARI